MLRAASQAECAGSIPVIGSTLNSANGARTVRTLYGLGSALFSMFGIMFFIRDAESKLAGSGISARRAGDILGATGDATSSATLDPERTAWVISQATSSMLDAADALDLIMTVIPLTAIALALVLFRRKRGAPPVSRCLKAHW
ncbi:hypothetical protein ORI20_30185 [Mycobacterium sp. CVI_P3]|uniref:MFS transporter n=1 Tax=Mycobacterium pinniadriaticum TaxID=2994102 RepID=A0ABT3SN65_9MYCO|nr:hypothetical protein [Mycobacterium pinniadriaticum]MCX2934541.1 hypothetical protein [Mycobacterium pinniadriaticum]MCX2940964.1 hypothetical protein [Mycobacterium pinniadriaticum]